jgi:LysM repeat protein
MKVPKMQKDFKTGMALGLVLAMIAIVTISTRPGLSIKARLLSPDSAVHRGMGIPLQKTSVSRSADERAGSGGTEQRKGTVRVHIVNSGETLSDISYKYYGSADKWQKILGADGLPVENPGKLIPGTKLIIPE